MSYQLRILKDNPIGFWPLDETSGTSAYDLSGAGNDGTYTGSISTSIFPLVPGGLHGTKISTAEYISFPITKNYYGATEAHGLATKYSSANSFSLEIWFKENILSTNKNTIFADEANNIGLFWQNGNIIFGLGAESVEYTCIYTGSAKHIVAVYAEKVAYIYIDSILVKTQSLENFSFSNSTFTLSCGPSETGDIFYIDAPAVYRYALSSDQIQKHFQSSNSSSPRQMVADKQGKIFSLNDYNMEKNVIRSYPINKEWSTFYDEDLYYDRDENYIAIAETETAESKTVVIEDYFSLPSISNMVSSKIEWLSTEGVSVEISTDGETYQSCTNGQAIPQFIQGTSSFENANEIYLKITLQSSDTTRYIPRLYVLNIIFYPTKILYSQNSGDFISSEEDESTWDYDLGSAYYSPLLRNEFSGLIQGESGFYIDTENDIYSFDMIFTPKNIPASGTFSLFESSTSIYYKFGEAAPAGISIYVNNIDQSSNTSTSSFLTINEPHHIAVVLDNPISNKIYFGKGAGSNKHQYDNIFVYETELTTSQIEDNYNLYLERPSVEVLESSMSMTEVGTEFYNYDWIYVKSK